MSSEKNYMCGYVHKHVLVYTDMPIDKNSKANTYISYKHIQPGI